MPHSNQRYLFIDLLRFFAVVFMIQGHTFDALLDIETRTHSLYYIHDFFHGFIAPMFLFASGVAFGISTLKKWEEYTVLSKKLFRRIGKYFGLIVIGYALHLPFFSFRKILTEATPTEIAQWVQVDVLQCIGITLLVLQLLVLVIKNERYYIWFIIASASLMIFLAPIVWSLKLSIEFPLLFASYFNAENNSWFPIFPWAGYILFGVVFSSLYLNAKEHQHAVALMQKVLVFGVLAIIVSVMVTHFPMNLYPEHDFWKTNPIVIFARLAFVLVITSSIFFADQTYKIRTQIPQIMGRESLFIYVLHLVIIYGSVVNDGLHQYFSKQFTIAQSTFSAIGILLFISLIAYGWYYFKQNFTKSAVVVRYSAAAIFIFLFFYRDF